MQPKMNAKITFISAGAGSGKTHRLTEILNKELNSGGVRPSGVIATTFTKKAATELRERVRAHLLKQGNFTLASAMGQARIGTVNSICGQLISRFAFEAGISTDQQVLEEVQAGVILGKAIDAVLDGAGMRGLQNTARCLGLEEEWKDSLKSLVDQVRANDIPIAEIGGFAQRNADDLLSHFPKPAVQNLDQDLLSAIHTAMPAIEAAAQSGGKKNTNNYLALVRTFAESLKSGTTTWSDWAKLSKESPEAGLRNTIEPIASLAGRLAEHGRPHADLRSYLEQIFNLAAKALDSYYKIKQEMGALDFADQEHLLLSLLDHESVADVLNGELDLLMVDEFQDTSPIQLALFLKLARFAKRVYWVGDIKQAIYSFRGSDTELMQAILKALPDLGGTKEVLPWSWRSRPELVRAVNAAFSNAFSNSLAKEEVELKPTRTDALSGPALANWILGGKNVGQEASALAAGVRRLVDSKRTIYDKDVNAIRPVRYGDIAILSRSNDKVKELAFALSKQCVDEYNREREAMEAPTSVKGNLPDTGKETSSASADPLSAIQSALLNARSMMGAGTANGNSSTTQPALAQAGTPGAFEQRSDYERQNDQEQKTAFGLQHSKQQTEYLNATRKPAEGQYEVKAGWLIPAILEQQLNSDLPGMIRALVRENVFDSATGRYILIPSGSTLIGVYNSHVGYGQSALQAVWQRVIFPDGSSLALGGFEGDDNAGAAGFRDQVNNHWGRILSGALLTSVFAAGIEVSQGTNSSVLQSQSVGQTVGQAVGQQVGQLGTEVTRRNLNIQPTVVVRPGYRFFVRVEKDILFSGPYGPLTAMSIGGTGRSVSSSSEARVTKAVKRGPGGSQQDSQKEINSQGEP